LIKAATMLVTVGAIAAGGLGAAATADARPPGPGPSPAPGVPEQSQSGVQTYGALAYSATTGVWATASGQWGSAASAQAMAITTCQNAGGGNCTSAGDVSDGCRALAVGEDNAVALNRWQSRAGATKVAAQTAAIDANGGGRIAAVSCGSPNTANPHYETYTGRVGTPRF
jgi:hypothetical protein